MKRFALAVVPLTLAAFVAQAPAATASTVTFSASVSCTAGDWVNIRTFNSGGTIKLWQISSDPYSVTRAHLQSTVTGRNTSNKLVGNNQTISWTGVSSSTYRTWANRDNDSNCNGIMPGNGWYTADLGMSY